MLYPPDTDGTKENIKILLSYGLKLPVEEILHESSVMMPVVLIVVCFVERPLRFFGAVA